MRYLPSVERAGAIAAGLFAHLPEAQQANAIAGFQECIKYLQVVGGAYSEGWETPAGWVSTLQRNPLVEGYYYVLRGGSTPEDVCRAHPAVHYWYADKKVWSSTTDYWLDLSQERANATAPKKGTSVRLHLKDMEYVFEDGLLVRVINNAE